MYSIISYVKIPHKLYNYPWDNLYHLLDNQLHNVKIIVHVIIVSIFRHKTSSPKVLSNGKGGNSQEEIDIMLMTADKSTSAEKKGACEMILLPLIFFYLIISAIAFSLINFV